MTEAEVAPDPADYPGADPDLLVPGSLVFRASEGPVDLRDVRNWWEGARRDLADAGGPRQLGRGPPGPPRHPGGVRRRGGVRRVGRQGPAHRGRMERPRAAASRGRSTRGATSSHRAGDDGQHLAGASPGRTCWRTASPAPRRSAASGQRLRPERRDRQRLGVDERLLRDAGARPAAVLRAGEPARDGRGGQRRAGEAHPRRVIKGGSHLCAPNYCLRYRPPPASPRRSRPPRHIGFRCVVRPA